MKKSTKIVLITAAALIVLGIIISSISLKDGANIEVRRLAERTAQIHLVAVWFIAEEQLLCEHCYHKLCPDAAAVIEGAQLPDDAELFMLRGLQRRELLSAHYYIYIVRRARQPHDLKREAVKILTACRMG